MKRRRILSFLGAFSLYASNASLVLSQTEGEINLIVPFPPGGGGDNFARSVVDLFEEKLGEKIWISNRPGAGGSIGTGSLINSKPGSKVLGYVTNGIMCVNNRLYPTLRYNPIKELIPIGQLSQIGLVMVLNPKAIEGVEDFDSLIKYAKEHPGEVNFASSGVGTTSHLAVEYLSSKLGLTFTHIPHSGGASAIIEVLAGRIPFMIDVSSNVIPYVQKGLLKPLAVTTKERLKLLPQVPTMQEKGIGGYELYAWDGLVVPKGTDQRDVEKYSTAFSLLGLDDKARKRIEKLGATPVFSNGRAFSELISEEDPKWKSLIEQIKLSKE